MSRFLLLLAVLGLAGCSQDDDARKAAAAAAKEAATARAETAALKDTFERFRAFTTDELQKNYDHIGGVEHNLSGLESEVSRNRIPIFADLTSDGQGYALCLTSTGPFALSIAGITPYLDGFKVHLEVGNLTSGTITDGAIRGFSNTAPPVAPDMSENADGPWKAYKKARDEWTNKEKMLVDDAKFSNLPAGTWGYTDLIILKVKPADIATFRLIVVPSGISLRPGKKPVQ
jgi:hypothetical protein